MRELNVNEMEEVSGGGHRKGFGWGLVFEIIDWGMAQDWGDASDNWDTNLAP